MLEWEGMFKPIKNGFGKNLRDKIFYGGKYGIFTFLDV